MFKWSLKLARVAGIGIYVHWTFALLLIWVAWIYLAQGLGALVAAQGVGLVLAIFVCIVLHELGHALTAKRFGINTRDITLLPIGGVARLERMPEDPREELMVALAGPAVNVVIAAVLLVGLWATVGVRGIGEVDWLAGDFFHRLMYINVILVAFNLLPAFPMDGGRVLRAGLATRLPYVKATRIAAAGGQGMAILFGLLGLLVGNIFLLFIAFFVFLGAKGEAQMVEVRQAFRGVRVGEAMIRHFKILGRGDGLQTAIDELLAGSQQDFPVVDEGGRIVGLLTRDDLIRAVAGKRHEALVGEVMRRDCPTVSEQDWLEEVFQRMREANCPAAAVMRGGEVVGVLTSENVSEFMMIQSALARRMGESAQGAPGRVPPPPPPDDLRGLYPGSRQS